MTTLTPGTLISDWLAAHGQSSASLARSAGISPPHLSLVLSGKKGLSAASADRIAGVTGIDVRLLLGVSIPTPERAA